MCERLGIDFGEQGYDAFGRWTLAKPELRQLVRRPLFCQMLVETRKDIVKMLDVNIAGLYETYVRRYFENVSERSPIRHMFVDLDDEIAYKKSCLMATAVKMLESNILRVSQKEIEAALLREAQSYEHEMLMAFTRLDTLIYSLLVADADRRFSFSHKSLYDFFVACKILDDISEGPDRFDLLRRVLLTKDVISFLAALLQKHELRDELNGAFGSPGLQNLLDTYEGNRVLLRNLALTYLELEQKVEAINLDDLDFSGYILSSPGSPRELMQVSLDGCNLEATILMKANLKGSSLRSAKLNKCVLDHSDLRDVDFSGAELQDISCRGTRFSGAKFSGIILKGQDVHILMEALSAEQEAFPGQVDPNWVRKTQAILRRSAI
jgi:hypothetical protein